MNNNGDYTKSFVFLSDHSKKNLVNRFGSHSSLRKNDSFDVYSRYQYGYNQYGYIKNDNNMPLFERKSCLNMKYINFNKVAYMYNHLFNPTMKSISRRVLTLNDYSYVEDPFYDDDYNYYMQKKEEERKATIFLRLIRKLRGNKENYVL